MKKIKNFFIKNKIKVLLSLAIILAACTITAVSIALWNQDEDTQIIYNPVTNPNEKYFEYYAVVENASATDGFDYYPLSRIPEALESRVFGLAVARYTGFSTEVVIPKYANVKINDNDPVDLPVTHIINNYTDKLGNNLGSLAKVVIPRSVIYVEAGALTGVANIIVEGDVSENQFILPASGDEVVIKDSTNTNTIDTLQKYDETHYLSTQTLDLYTVNDGNITYIYPSLLYLYVGEVKYTGTPLQPKTIYGLSGYGEAVKVNNRPNIATYRLTDGNENNPSLKTDLFGKSSGYLLSDENGQQYTYIVNNDVTAYFELTIGEEIRKVELDGIGKYKVTMHGPEYGYALTASPITYTANGSTMALDTSFTDYERYVYDGILDGKVTIKTGETVLATSIESYNGTYEVIYTPDMVLTDLENKTQLSVNEIYYIHQIEDAPLATNLVSFKINEVEGINYFAQFDDNSVVKLNKMATGIYSTPRTDAQTGTVTILGMDSSNNLVYESHSFSYTEGNEYDLTTTTTSLVSTTKKLDSSVYQYVVNVPSGITPINLLVNGEFYAVNSNFDLYNTTLSIPFDDGVITSADYLSGTITSSLLKGRDQTEAVNAYEPYYTNLKNILRNDSILSSKYIFKSYTITLVYDGGTILLFSYTNPNQFSASNDLDFYQKEYKVSYQESSSVITDYYLYTNVGKLKRNFANIKDLEYYYDLTSGQYVISKNDSITNIGEEDYYLTNNESSLLLFNVNKNSINLSVKDSINSNELLTSDSENIYKQGLIYVEEYRNGLEPGLYRVVKHNGTLVYTRVEGSKEYYISGDGTNYHKMVLVSNNTLFEEYNYSGLQVTQSQIIIKDELGNEYTYELANSTYDLITFSIDNLRRTSDDYLVFTNIHTSLADPSKLITITLSSNGNSKKYDIYKDNSALPNYEDVFTQLPGEEFIGWYIGEELQTKAVEGSTYVARFNTWLATELSNYVTVEIISDANGNGLLNVGDEFKVIANHGYTVSSVMANSEAITLNTPTTVTEAMTRSVLTVTATANTYTVKFHDDTKSDIEVTYGETIRLGLPTVTTNFTYYYDSETGVILTDNNGNLISPYIIKKDTTVVAAYTSEYYVIVNTIVAGVTTISSITPYKSGSMFRGYFPRVEDSHYTSVNAYKLADNNPVEFTMDEYEHLYSFVMPSSNVVINVNYTKTTIEHIDASGSKTTLYVLIPSSFGKDVQIYDCVSNSYLDMIRLSTEEQIYPGYLIYKTNDDYDIANRYLRIKASNGESYVYDATDIDYALTNTLIIDNFSLENEVGYFTEIIRYTRDENVFTFTSTVDSFKAIDGNINVDGQTVTITKAINTHDKDYYQHASFEAVVSHGPVKLSIILTYKALGTKKDPILINYDYDFYEFFNNPVYGYLEGLYFKQTGDVTISDDDGYDIIFNQINPFNHNYDGNGYTVNYSQSVIRDDVNNGLFGYIGPNGTVTNIKLNYNLLDTNNIAGYDTKYYLGSIASVNTGTISSITTSSNYITVNNVRYVGGIVGYNYYKITNCTNNIAYLLYDYGVNYSNIVGGIAGYNAGSITNCINYAKQSISTQTGQTTYSGDIAALDKGTISGCTSYGGTIGNAHITDLKTYYYTDNQDAAYGDKVYIYAYKKGSSDINAEFPGKLMDWEKDSSNEKIYKTEIEADYDYFIFSKYNSEGVKVYETVSIELNNNMRTDHTQFWKTNDVKGFGYGRNSAYFNSIYGLNNNYVLKVNEENIDLYNTKKVGNYQLAAFDIELNEGDILQVLPKVSNGLVLTGFTLDNSNFGYIDEKIICNKSGVYSLYFGYNKANITTSNNVKSLSDAQINAIFVDDWWFVDREITTQNGVYHLESAILATYKNESDVVIGKLEYSLGQIYQYNNMNSILIDVISGATKVEISRIMKITNNENGLDRFYFSYDEVSGFEKLSDFEFQSTPAQTYTYTVTDLSSENVYIYTTSSQSKYATANSDRNTSDALLVDKALEPSVVGYIDVTGIEEYATYRVKYYVDSNSNRLLDIDTDQMIAIRSYSKGDQLQLLSGVAFMSFEASFEGNGWKSLATGIIPTTEGKPLRIYNSDDSKEEIVSGNALYINKKELVSLYTNPSEGKSYEKMATAVELNAGDVIELVNVTNNGQTIDVLTFTNKGSSTTNLSFKTNAYTVVESGLYDFYYDTNTNQIYVGLATVYEILLYSDDNDLAPEVIRMSSNPKNNSEVMMTSLYIKNATHYFTLRVAGNKNSYSSLAWNEDSVGTTELSNTNQIHFTASNTYDIYIEKDLVVPRVYVGYSSTPQFNSYEYSAAESFGNAIQINEVGSSYFYFKPTAEFATGRIYYITSKGNYYYEYEGLSTSKFTQVPYVAGTTKMYICRYVDIDAQTPVVLSQIRVNSLYERKNLEITKPYYGYFDARWTSDVSDRDYLYFFTDASDVVYLEYELNDGRIGRLLMNEDNGYHKLNWDSVIGLNPSKLWFVVNSTRATYGPIDLNSINILSSNCYYVNKEGNLSSRAYSDYNEVVLNISADYPSWFDYYVQVDVNNDDDASNDLYYKMERKSDSRFIAYIPIKVDNYFYITSTHLEENIAVKTNKLTYAQDTIYELKNNVTLSSYYLSGTVNGYATRDSLYRFTSFGGKYYLFVNLSEDITYDITGTDFKNLKLGSGYHMIVFDGINVPKVYSNYLTYKVDYVYGDSVYTQYYKLGDIIKAPSITPTSTPTAQHTFTFAGWVYDGIKYTKKESNLVDSNSNELIVTSNMTLYPTFYATLNKYSVTFISHNNIDSDSALTKTIEVDYGKRLSTVLSDPTVMAQLEILQTYSGQTEGWFKGWYLDKGFDLKPDNYIVRDDVTLYANWIFEGMYLIGTIEGYQDWNNPRLDYQFINNELRHVFLQENDIVKVYKVSKDGDSYKVDWIPNNDKNWTDTDSTGAQVDENNKNLTLKKTGYYSFYYSDGNVSFTYQEYIVYYDENGGEADYDDYRFNMTDNKWNIYTAVDATDDKPVAVADRTSPTATNGDLVLYGWFNRPLGGERITQLTSELMDRKNSATLYAQYIKSGYYVNGSDLSNLLTSTPIEVVVDAENPLKLYHYKGSAYGSSVININIITGDNSKSNDGNWSIAYTYGINGEDANNTINNLPYGTYKISFVNDEIVLDQYHEVTYVMGELGTVDGTSGIYTTTQKYNSSLKQFTFVSSPNVTFVGWMTDPSGSGSYVTNVTSDMTVYAIYRVGSVDGNIPGHEHAYNVYKSDTTNHWLACSCGAVKAGSVTTHTNINNYDLNYHWQECSVCGYVSDKAEHIDGSTAYNETYHWTPCTGCSIQKNLTVHNFTADYLSDETQHWHQCSCGAIDSKELHVYSGEYEKNETQHSISCDICGQTKTEDHTFVYHSVDANTHIGTCTSCEYIVEGNHTISYDPNDNNDASQHYQKCEICKGKFNFADHVWNEQGSINNGVATFTCSQAGCTATKTFTEVTVYFKNDWIWTDVRIYDWGTGAGASYPGTNMTFVEKHTDEYDIYSYDVKLTITGMQFNGINDKQVRDKTPDITNIFNANNITIKDGKCVMTICYYIHWDNGNKVSSFNYIP